MESLSHLTIEETYELIDAILNKNMDEIKVLHGPKAQTNKIMEFC